MRALYEGYAEALSGYLCMPLPPWIADRPHKDNWLAVAKLRAQSEAASSPSDTTTPANHEPQSFAALVDDRHEF